MMPDGGAIPRSVVDGLPLPILVSRASDDVVIMINAEFTSAYGHRSSDVVGMHSRELHFVEDDRRRALDAQAAGSHDPVEVQLETATGACVWAQSDVARFSLDGTEDVLLTVFHDIGAHKRAVEELSERARFPAMNPGPVARLAADGTIIRANPAASELFGHESLVGISWLDLCPGIDSPLWTRIRESDAPVQVEADIGDRCISFTLRHEPISDQVFVYGSDVTALKDAEKALGELARFPDMNPGPVCRLDRAGRVVLANPAARQVFDCADLTGRSWFELVPSVDEAFWQHILDSDGTSSVEAKVGDRHFVLTYAPGPEGLFVFVYGSDVTREKEAERALRQTERMATLGTLAAGIAHELNNPAAAAQRAADQLERSLAAMEEAYVRMGAEGALADAADVLRRLDARAREAAGCACDLDPLARSDLESDIEDWMEEYDVDAPWEIASALVEGQVDLRQLERLAEEVGPRHTGLIVTWHAHAHRVYRLLDEIRHGTGRLAEIVGAMKSYSYLGQAPLQNVDVNEGIRDTLIIMRSKLKEGVTVEMDLAADLPRIEAFGSELNQVWTNLIDNAVDAMNGRGRIRLRTSARDGRVTVEVEDDGPGIPAEAKDQVFDAFFTTKAPGKGTGLGLNTSYNIVVQKHHGSITVDSVPGRTCFTVELPRRLGTNGPASGSEPGAGGDGV